MQIEFTPGVAAAIGMVRDYMDMAGGKKTGRAKAPPPPAEMAGLPDRLRRAMRDRELDQVALSKLAGVSQGTISKLTRGESLEGTTASVVAHLAIALGVPSGWLLTGENDVIPRALARARRGQVAALDEGTDELVPRAASEPAPSERRGKPA